MSPTRGFSGRPQPSADPKRIPPGQYLTSDFPVLSAGPTPRTPLDRVVVISLMAVVVGSWALPPHGHDE